MSEDSGKVSQSYVRAGTGGPHGLGDPDDRTLRKVEKDILIPKKVRDKSRTEKCVPEVIAFGKCCKETSVLSVMKCQTENSALKTCLEKWFYDEELNKQCTEEYLKERSEYRQTGIPKKLRDRMKIQEALLQ